MDIEHGMHEHMYKRVCLCVCVCLYICVYVLGDSEKSIQSSGVGIMGSCEPRFSGSKETPISKILMAIQKSVFLRNFVKLVQLC